jgi:putative nucleotidyltransferase with HDIG domain
MLLIKCAEALKKSYPYENRIFRIGGDEFVVLVPNVQPDQAEEIVKRMKENCEKETVNAINLSVSLGWETKNMMSEGINAVLKSAEDFMYKKKLFDGPSMRGKTISLIINTLHEKNRREEQHSHRVAELCEKLAIAMKMPEHERKEIRSAGLLHDIGKIAIKESILNKPGRLTPEEYEEITKHPEIGYRILYSANEMTDIAEYVLSHHERWDGSGYPRGLKGEGIPLQARMIAIADAFDAMTSIRSYRMPFTEEEAAKEIYHNAGTQFDPELAVLFVHEVLGYQFDA